MKRREEIERRPEILFEAPGGERDLGQREKRRRPEDKRVVFLYKNGRMKM